MAKSDVLAIIPARGGSKRIPGKNIIPVAGKPLICHTIESALKSKFVTKVVVSTDDNEIAVVAQGFGATVIMRSAEISGDSSHTEDAMIHALECLRKEGYSPEMTVLLQCTSPLRETADIDDAIQLMIDTGCDTVLSVSHNQHYYLSGSIDEKSMKFTPDYSKRPFSNMMQKKYKENGAIYVTRTKMLLKSRNRICGDVRAIVMDAVKSLDIDEPEDLQLIGNLLEMRKLWENAKANMRRE